MSIHVVLRPRIMIQFDYLLVRSKMKVTLEFDGCGISVVVFLRQRSSDMSSRCKFIHDGRCRVSMIILIVKDE